MRSSVYIDRYWNVHDAFVTENNPNDHPTDEQTIYGVMIQ